MDLPEILRDRDDINEQDIPAILLRAEQLQVASEGSEAELTSVNDIGQQYIEEALEEFPQKKGGRQQRSHERGRQRTDISSTTPVQKRDDNGFSLIGFILLTMLAIVMSDWTMPWHTTYSPPVVSSEEKEWTMRTVSMMVLGGRKVVEFERPSFTRRVLEAPEDTGFVNEEIPDEQPAPSATFACVGRGFARRMGPDGILLLGQGKIQYTTRNQPIPRSRVPSVFTRTVFSSDGFRVVFLQSICCFRSCVHPTRCCGLTGSGSISSAFHGRFVFHFRFQKRS